MASNQRLPEADLEAIVDQTSGIWDDPRGARLFVTGGTGFFGRWLLESLLCADERLGLGVTAVVLTRNPDAFRDKAPHIACHPAVGLVEGDVRTFDLSIGPFTHVIHGAMEGVGQVLTADPAEVVDVAVLGTRRTLDLAKAGGSSKYLLISSAAVYGRLGPDDIPVSEDHPWNVSDQDSAYALGKRASETLAGEYADSIAIKIARGFAVIGPGMAADRGFAVGNFIQQALSGEDIVITSDGTPIRSFLYATDLAAWLWTILIRGERMRPYNVGSDVALTIEDAARVVRAQFDDRPSIVIQGSRNAGAASDACVPSVERAHRELGLRQTVPFVEAVRRTTGWFTSVTAPRRRRQPMRMSTESEEHRK